MVTSLKKKKNLKNFTILIHIKLNFFKIRFKVTAILNIKINKNFILYRFLLKAD
jgi:hypothetical protein